MFHCFDWATTLILKNIPDSLGDIERERVSEYKSFWHALDCGHVYHPCLQCTVVSYAGPEWRPEIFKQMLMRVLALWNLCYMFIKSFLFLFKWKLQRIWPWNLNLIVIAMVFVTRKEKTRTTVWRRAEESSCIAKEWFNWNQYQSIK